MHRRPFSRTWSIVLGAAVVAGSIVVGSQPAHAATTVEDTFRSPGMYTPVWDDGTPSGPSGGHPCDTAPHPATPDPLDPDKRARSFTFVYPSNIASLPPRPLIVWGNSFWFGNDPRITCYSRVAMEHLARWGYVVVAPNTSKTGDGADMLVATMTAIARNGGSPAGHPLTGKIDFTKVGAIGHSEGADGAAHFAAGNPSFVKSVAFLSLSDESWLRAVGAPPATASVRQLTMPVFFTREGLSLLGVQTSSAATNAYYDAAPGPKVRATLTTANHISIGQQLADRGYVTAWFRYTLEGDNVSARRAFVGGTNGTCDSAVKPEICTNTPRWAEVKMQGLP